MKRVLSMLVAGFAFLGVVSGLPLSADASDSAWFSEDSASFTENAQSRWSYSPEAASAVGAKIFIDIPADESGESVLQEVSYEAPSLPSQTRSVSLDFNRVVFATVGPPTLALSSSSTFGLQVVEASGGCRFAIYDPTTAVNAWIVTSRPAVLETVEYDIRVRIVFDGDSKRAYYSCSTNHVDYEEIGSAAFPPTAAMPGEIGFLGKGSLETVAGLHSADESADYEKWSSLAAILSWRASGSASQSADPKTESAAKFCRFSKSGSVWSNDLSVTWSGPESQTYSNIPGYTGSAPIWKALSYGQAGYVAPGLALRFAAAEPAAPGSLGALSFSSSVFSLGGLIVESGATGHSIVGADASGIAKTYLGDPAGKKTTWFWAAEDFSISRGTAAGSEARVYGAANIFVSEGRTLSLNAGSSVPLTLDATTHAVLTLQGAGRLQVPSLVATGDVTLDLSRLDLTRSEAFLSGDLAVNGSTTLKFPASFLPGAEMKLCTGSVSGLASASRSVFVDGVLTNVYLTVEGNVVRRGENVARATISNDVAWSEIAWEPGCEWRPGLPVELTFASAARVVLDREVVAGRMTVYGNAVGTIDCSAYAPSCSSLIVPEGVGLVLAGPQESACDFAVPLQVDGLLLTCGRLRLSSAANVFSSLSTLHPSDGTLVLEAFSSFAGSVVVEANATLQLQKTLTSPSVDVWGILDVGSTRLTIDATRALVLHIGSKVTGTTGDLNFTSTAHGLRVADDGKSGVATLACNLRLSQSAPFEVEGDMTLLLDNPGLVADMHKGFRKTGSGTLAFSSAAVTGYSSAVTVVGGLIDFPSEFAFDASLALESVVTWRAHQKGMTISGALSLAGPLLIDASDISVDSYAVLSATDLTAFDVANVFATDGAWKFTRNATTVTATRKQSSERTDWDYARGVFSYESTGGTKFQEATYRLYDPVSGTKSSSFVASTLSTTLPGWKGVSIYPWQLFSSSATKGRAVVPGYVMCFLSSVKAQTIPAVLTLNEPDNLHFAGLLVDTGATGISFNSDSDVYNRSTRFGDLRAGAGAETRFVFHESFGFSRRGSFEFLGKVNLYIDSAKELDANSARTGEVCRPTLASGSELKMHGAGSLAVSTLVAKGDVVLDYSDLALSRQTPYITGGSTGGNLEIDAGTRFRFPEGFLAVSNSYCLCSGQLVGAADGVRYISVGAKSFYAALTFTSNSVSYAETKVNRATLGEGSSRWQDLVWNDGSGWIADAPAVITLTGDARLSHLSSDPSVSRVIFDGPYQIGFGYDSNVIGEVVYQNGAQPVPVDYIWTGDGDGESWEDAGNWSGGVVPCVGAQVQFLSSASVVARQAVAGALILSSGTVLNLTLHVDGRIDGVSGGSLVKLGTADLRIGPNAASGYTVSDVKIRSNSANVLLEGSAQGTRLRNLSLVCSTGRIVLADGGQILVEGQLVLEANGDVAGRLFEPIAESEDGSSSAVLTGSATIRKTGDGLCSLLCRVGRSSVPYEGDVVVDSGTLSFEGVAEDEVNALTGELRGAGRVGVNGRAALRISGATLPAGGFVGSGVVVVQTLPSTQTKAFSGSDWIGTLFFDGVTLPSFYPARYGTLFSTIRMKGCAGSLRPGSYDVLPAISLVHDAAKPALDLTSGRAGDVVTFRALEGDGALRFSYAAAEASESGVTIEGSPSFTGSYELSDGDIDVASGTRALVGPLSIWSVGELGRIDVQAGATVTSSGLFLSQVIGGGLLNYTGNLDARRIEPEAGLTYAQSWTGAVCVTQAALEGARLDLGVNENSQLILSDIAVTNLAEQNILWLVSVTGNVAIAAIENPVVFSRGISGEGSIEVLEGSTGDSWWRFDDLVGYSGMLTVGKGSASLGLGEFAAGPKAGGLVFGEGVSVMSGLGWSSEAVSFGATMNIFGDPEDVLVRVPIDTPYTDYSLVRLKIEGDDDRIVYRLRMDQTTGDLHVSQGASPPTIDIGAVDISYGPDMTNATVTVTVTNFWGGIDYKGPNYIRVWIYDSKGKAYDVLGGTVTGNGVYELGVLPLPEPDASGYTYRAEVSARENDFEEEELVDEKSIIEPLAHTNAYWVYENASTFPSAAPKKTGVWTWSGSSPQSHLFAEDGVIRIKTDGAESSAYAQFAANEPGRGVVRYELEFSIDGSAVEAEAPAGAQGAISIPDGTEEVWALNPSNGVYEVALSPLRDVERHHLVTTFNYVDGTVNYVLDGELLRTADHPSGLFALSANQIEANRANGMRVVGGDASLDLLTGVQFSTNLAQAVIGEETNEWKSVNAAIEDLTARGIRDATLKLLWDSTWAPQTNSLGSTFRFDMNGFDLLIDPAVTNRIANEGYRVVAKGTDTYEIDVITYELSFAPVAADAKGTMPSVPFSVTNRVLRLPANVFERNDFDFEKWGDSSEGEDVRTYEDEATIDLEPYGLKDVTLYARWKVKVRTITIEPTDEYVYIEYVATNGVEHTGVRFFGHEDPIELRKGRGKALIPVMNGSDLVIRFSTDLEKMLTYDKLLSRYAVAYDGTLTNDMPVVAATADQILTEIQYWAASRGISMSALAKSAYSMSSYRLNRPDLLTEETLVEISNFRVTETGCSFSVTIDGEPLEDSSLIAGMVWVSDRLDGDWTPAGAVTIDSATGLVDVQTQTPAQFVKIVIPENEKGD